MTDTPTATVAPTTTSGTTSTPQAAPIAFVTTGLPRARAGARYRATIRFTGPVEEELGAGQPSSGWVCSSHGRYLL